MNIFVSLHPQADTELSIMRWETDGVPCRAFRMGEGYSIYIASPDTARRMAELLNQIARELEAQDDAS